MLLPSTIKCFFLYAQNGWPLIMVSYIQTNLVTGFVTLTLYLFIIILCLENKDNYS